MKNAKEELLRELNQKWIAPIKCAAVECGKIVAKLKVGHTPQEFTEFLEKLDFEYDAGYGAQTLFGTVWLEDRSWLTRWKDYDSSEWWEHIEYQDIPEELGGTPPAEAESSP